MSAGMRGAIAASVAASAAPYGYTSSTWSSGALLIGPPRSPHGHRRVRLDHVPGVERGKDGGEVALNAVRLAVVHGDVRVGAGARHRRERSREPAAGNEMGRPRSGPEGAPSLARS